MARRGVYGKLPDVWLTLTGLSLRDAAMVLGVTFGGYNNY